MAKKKYRAKLGSGGRVDQCDTPEQNNVGKDAEMLTIILKKFLKKSAVDW